MLNSIDYDLHGHVGIRLLNAPPPIARSLSMGLAPTVLPGTPNLLVRFSERASIKDDRPAGPNEKLHTDQADGTHADNLVLRDRHLRTRARIHWSDGGARWSLECCRSIKDLQLWMPILQVAAFEAGLLAVHAGACRYRGRGILCAGLPDSGKTGVVLALAAQGATLVGDDCIFISPAKDRLYGLLQPFGVRLQYLEQFPVFCQAVEPTGLRRAQFFALLRRFGECLGRGAVGKMLRCRFTHRINQALASRERVIFDPSSALADNRFCTDAAFDLCLLAVRSQSQRVRVESVRPQEMAKRLAVLFDLELAPLRLAYQQHRVASRASPIELLDHAVPLGEHRLAAALAAKPCLIVHQSAGTPLQAIYEAVSPFIESTSNVSQEQLAHA